MKNEILLIGLGNILLKDDGVGVYVIRAVKEKYCFTPGVEMVDGGAMSLDLLPLFEERGKILIVDATDFGREPGHIEEIAGDDIPLVLQSKLSVHHIGLFDLLLAARLMEIKPSKICLIGIQPQSVAVGLEMTEQIRDKIEDLIDLTIKKLEEWNVRCVLQSL
jgi:hydrogenase maturation protease